MPSESIASFEQEPDLSTHEASPTHQQVDEPALEHPAEVAPQQAADEPTREPPSFEPPPPPEPRPAPAEAIAPAPPRRRSTVREPAPANFSDESGGAPAHPVVPPQPVEMPQPVVSSARESEDAEQPRRSGWWSRR
jgi:ribonuclease E